MNSLDSPGPVRVSHGIKSRSTPLSRALQGVAFRGPDHWPAAASRGGGPWPEGHGSGGSKISCDDIAISPFVLCLPPTLVGGQRSRTLSPEPASAGLLEEFKSPAETGSIAICRSSNHQLKLGTCLACSRVWVAWASTLARVESTDCPRARVLAHATRAMVAGHAKHIQSWWQTGTCSRMLHASREILEDAEHRPGSDRDPSGVF